MDDGESLSFGKRKSGTLKRRSHSQFDNGKQKKRNSSHDNSSMFPKEIETVFRILCPIKKIGSVLGKGGEIVNALRDETHAKIRVVDAIPGADERVIIIFNYPSKQTERFDTDLDPDNANLGENEYEDMRPHCRAQDALLKVHDRIVADEYIHGGVVHEKTELVDVVTARILVPTNQVGCLLGKGGSTIQKLRSESGATIRILLAEHLPPCATDTDELIQISGMPAVVKKALYEVSTMLHQHPRKENPPLEELLHASTQGLYRSGASMPPLPQEIPMLSYPHPFAHATPPIPWFGGHQNGSSGYGHGVFNSHENDGEMAEFSMKVLCATGKIGGVIGKGGANVRQLEQHTGAKIRVEDTAPEAEERVILVTSNEAPWDQISPTIEAVLQLQGKTNLISENGSITTRLLVPSSHVGCILGQGGNIITEMRKRTRANIQVFSKDEKPNYISDKEELVQISGNPTIAEEALLEIASRLRTRALLAGNAAVNPAPSGPVHGFAPSKSMPYRGIPSYGVIGAGNAVGYEHPKGTAPRHEAQVYPGPPTAIGYNGGLRHEAQGYPAPPTVTGYGAGPRHESQSYPGPPTGTLYGAGPRHEAQGYAGPPTATDYGAGPRHESQGYLGPPSATGYGAGSRHEAQGYPGPPTATGYGAPPWHEAQGFPDRPTDAWYGAGPRHEAQGYAGLPIATGYGAGPRHEAQGYAGLPTPTGYGARPRHEAQVFPGPPTATGYGAGTRDDAQFYPGLPTAAGYSAGPRHEAQGYPGPPTATGYPNVNSSVEVKIPNSQVSSGLGMGGSNISDIRQTHSGTAVGLLDRSGNLNYGQ